MDEAEQTGPTESRLGASFRRVSATLLSTLQNRIELFGVELQEEREWFLATVIWASALVFLSVCTAVIATITVVFFFPEERWPYVLLALCLVYLALSVGTALGLRRRIREKPPAFKDTVSEIKKDISSLRPTE